MTETKTPDLSRKRLSVISLSDQCKQVILGSLLGDGCLTHTKGLQKCTNANSSQYITRRLS